MREPMLRVVSLESRQASELARLLERHGCVAIGAPSMREVPLDDERDALAFGDRLLAGEVDVLVLLTGVGARGLVDALATRWPRARVLDALGRVVLVCRGSKPVAVLKQLGLRASCVAAEPNTWREVLAALDARADQLAVRGKRVFVQEYGRPSPELVAELRARGADVQCVAVYGWALPEDLAPLRRAIDLLCAGGADVLMVTSGRQIEHLLEVAQQMDRRDALLQALRERVVLASIGPMATEVLREHGLSADLEPEHPKMGQLVIAVAQGAAHLLAEKRARG
jgi:uroporphyrinogen-III synthase